VTELRERDQALKIDREIHCVEREQVYCAVVDPGALSPPEAVSSSGMVLLSNSVALTSACRHHER
jgi:hypothetical protein